MKTCITCQKPGALGICRDCAGRAESILHAPVRWTKFEKASIHPDVQAEGFDQCWKNSRYTVLQRDVRSQHGDLVHLSIKRNDRAPLHDWRDLQRIKNEILGHEEEAMELYPAESRLVDAANQYHLWCFMGMRAPFGYDVDRCVMEENGEGAKQRPFEERPKDLLTEEQFQEKLTAYQQRQVAKKGYSQQIQAILDEASGGGCQNPFRYTDERQCEAVKPDQPALWCGPCMARVLRKLGMEANALT